MKASRSNIQVREMEDIEYVRYRHRGLNNQPQGKIRNQGAGQRTVRLRGRLVKPQSDVPPGTQGAK